MIIWDDNGMYELVVRGSGSKVLVFEWVDANIGILWHWPWGWGRREAIIQRARRYAISICRIQDAFLVLSVVIVLKTRLLQAHTSLAPETDQGETKTHCESKHIEMNKNQVNDKDFLGKSHALMLAWRGTRSWLLYCQVTCPPRRMYNAGERSSKKQQKANYTESWKTSRHPLKKHIDKTTEYKREPPMLGICSGVETNTLNKGKNRTKE